MNPPSRRSTRENAINKETANTIIATKSKLESKPAVISYDYEAAISQPDIPSKIDNTQNPSWSESSDELSAPTKKRNLYTYGKANVITKKRGIILCKTKKVMKIHPQHICNIEEIKKESILSSEITRNTENFGNEKIDAASWETPLNPYQKNLMHSRDIQKPPEIAENDKNFMNVVVHVSQGTGNSCNEKNSDKIDKDGRLYISQNKASKIPRIKPNSFSPAYEGSHVYSNRKMPMKNKLKCSINMKSPTECNEEKNEIINNLKKETVKIDDYQKLQTKNLLQTVHGNSINPWYPEKSSEMDADEELEEDSPTTESPVITGDDPRSATLLKSLALKCSCHTGRCTETESWSSPEIENVKKWKKKSIKHRKFIDSEDLDLMSDYNAINYKNSHLNGKNRTIFANHVIKSSLAKPAKIQTYQTTSFSFFNVFFDIVFWPFVFLRAKQ